MEQLLASISTSISELKKNPTAVFSKAMGEPIAILTHNKPTGYYVPAETFEALIDKLEESELIETTKQRLLTLKDSIEISIDDL